MYQLRLAQWLLCFVVIISQPANALGGETPTGGCSWDGPSPEWILARHPPVGNISGSLSVKVIPFLRHSGIPISLIMKSARDDDSLLLRIDAATTTKDVLEEIERQLPEYHHAVVSRHIVLYPREPDYDAPVELPALTGVTRARALLSIIRELRVKIKILKDLNLPTLSGGGHRTLYGDTVEVGGRRTVVEHLVSLIKNHPSVAFSVIPEQDGHLGFGFFSIPLVQKIAVGVPSSVALGESFQAIAKVILSDGSAVPLVGPECHVEYEISGHGELAVDDAGHVVTLRRGVAGVVILYENKSDLAKVEVY